MAVKIYDYIVIGAGSAGCVVAARLSERRDRRVLLVEAGESDRSFMLGFKTRLPVGNVFLLPDSRYNWGDTFIASPDDPARQVICPRGKLFGGCSSVNGTVYMRGHPGDYDHWKELGNVGWGWEDVLPAFRAHENRSGGDDPLHGMGGELDVVPLRDPSRVSLALARAAKEAGHSENRDFNGSQQDGFGLFEVNQRDGMRLSAARAFLHPALDRPNLHVLDQTTVERITVENGRATGIVAVRKGERMHLGASSEIVLSCGTINSPHLLLLSGIGPADELRRHGIDIVADLPGIGRNLHDHPAVTVAVEDRSGQSLALSGRSIPRLAIDLLRYAAAGRGSLTSNVAESGGFLRSRPGLNRPDVQVTFMVGLKSNAALVPRRHGFMAIINVCRPESRGHMELRSANPTDRPILHANFLSSPGDMETLVRGVTAVREIFAQPSLASMRGAEITPGEDVRTDAQIADFVRRTVATVYHPVGTCRMGPAGDPLAVVDPQLRLHGIAGLRVADASIMPAIVAGNTSAPAMMIGERAAEFIRGASAGARAAA